MCLHLELPSLSRTGDRLPSKVRQRVFYLLLQKTELENWDFGRRPHKNGNPLFARATAECPHHVKELETVVFNRMLNFLVYRDT